MGGTVIDFRNSISLCWVFEVCFCSFSMTRLKTRHCWIIFSYITFYNNMYCILVITLYKLWKSVERGRFFFFTNMASSSQNVSLFHSVTYILCHIAVQMPLSVYWTFFLSFLDTLYHIVNEKGKEPESKFNLIKRANTFLWFTFYMAEWLELRSQSF